MQTSQAGVWEEARDRYQRTLNFDQQKQFQDAFSTTATYDDILAVSKSNEQTESHKFSSGLQKLLAPLQELAPIFDVISNINGLVGCSIWGPLKLIVQASSKYSEGLDLMFSFIETLTANMRRYKLIEVIHQSEIVRDVLRDFYFDLIDFAVRCMKYLNRNRAVNGLPAVFKPFSAEVKDVIANINRHASAVDKTAVVAEMKEADISRRLAQAHITESSSFRESRLVKDLHTREKSIRLWLNTDGIKDEQKRRQNERVPGTNMWFLQGEAFRNWMDPNLQSDNSRLLWVCGKAGCGKSILASSIIARLQEMGIQPIFFFFNSKSGDAASSEPIGFVRTLLFQLLDIDPRLTELLYRTIVKSGSQVASSFADLWEVFRMWCLRRSEPVFCVS